MFSIGEFSRVSGIPVRTLRFYHEQRVLVPAAVDAQTNYRSYDQHNFDVARVIVALRRLEFSLDDIREILADCDDDRDVLVHLEQQRESLTKRLEHYSNIVRQIDDLIHQQRHAREEEQMNAAAYEIVERDLEPMLVAGIRMCGRYSECGKGFATLGRRLGRHIAGKPFCLIYDGEYREEDANFEPCMPIRKRVAADGVSVHELPGGRCVSLMYRGPYDEMGRSYARALEYAKQEGYEVQLPTREVYHKGPGMIFRGNPKKYVTEIQLPVTKS
ncbi:MAG TPA: GyrI-like domain-containing protein [Lacipirellulaceae bacterium]|jgi:DNA-binding transcriptional MerR regulator